MNSSTGALTKIGTFPAGVVTHGVATSPDNRFLYAFNGIGQSISGFVINPTTGTLTSAPGSPFPAGSGGHSVIVEPKGRFAYGGNASSISAYTINTTTGALTPVAGSPFPVATSFNMACDPNGRFLYAPNLIGTGVSVLAIDQTTGALVAIPGSPFASGTFPTEIAIDPLGRFAYVGNGTGTTLNGFRINPSTGGLSPLPGSPFPSGEARAVTIDPTGRFVFTANETNATVNGFSIDPNTGSLTKISGSPYPVGSTPAAVVVDPTSQFLYVGNASSNSISALRINQGTGQLTTLTGSPFPAGQEPLYFAIATPTATSTLGVQFIQPTHGGNAGLVTMQIVGSGFQAGAAVKLTGLGPDIIGTNTNAPTASILNTTFDLTGATPGPRTLVVTNPDGTSTPLIGGFTVEQGGAAQISVEIVGRDRVRIGTPQTYYAAFRNRGTVDSKSALVTVTVPGRIQLSPVASPTDPFAGKRDLIATPSASAGKSSSFTAASITDLVTAALWAAPPIAPGSSWLVPCTIGVVSGTSDIASFLISSRWNSSTSLPDPSNVPIETYVQAVGCPAPDYSRHCINCFSQAQAVGNAFADARLAYAGIARGSDDFSIATATLARNLAELAASAIGAKLAVSAAGLGGTASGELLEVGADLLLGRLLSLRSLFNPDTSRADYWRDFLNDLAAFKAQAIAFQVNISLNDPAKLPVISPAFSTFINVATAVVPVLDGLAGLVEARDRQAIAFAAFGGKLQLYCQARQSYLSCLDSSCSGRPTPPPDPIDTDEGQINVSPVTSLDPNEKIGLRGAGTAHYTAVDAQTQYAIFFENKPTATAPAEIVVITDALDTVLDLNTLALGPITFPNQVVTPPAIPLSVAPFATTVDLRPTTNLLVKINTSLNTSTRILTWTFQSLDPATNQPPADPLAGFLPPGAEGSVFFTVMPKPTVTTGTVIQNTATIVFDVNAPINTPTWSNTIDNTKPTSHVNPLPATQTTTSFSVSWSGSDVGAGIQGFTVYASDNGGPFTAFQTNTTATSATFTGIVSHTYAFYSIARDLVGNVESSKTTAEATTTVKQQVTGLTITNYQLVSQQAAAAGKSAVTYRADLLSPGTALGSVTATATTLDPVAIRLLPGQDTLTFSPIPANGQVTSKNSFTILVDASIPLDSSKLQWTFQSTPAPPVANAGPNQTVTPGSTVTLDGRGSTNPSGIGSLAFSWMFTSRPPGSNTRLVFTTSPTPTFVPDVAGTYVISLTVSNGVASGSTSVTVNAQ